MRSVRLLVSASLNQPANSVFLSQKTSTSQPKPAPAPTSEQARCCGGFVGVGVVRGSGVWGASSLGAARPGGRLLLWCRLDVLFGRRASW